MKKFFQERFNAFAREVGLCNESGEYPIVVSVSPDPNNEATYIITVQDCGTPLPLPVALDEEIGCLQRRLGGIVFDLSFGNDTTQSQFRLKQTGGGQA